MGVELTPPVTFRLRAGSGPLYISGQHVSSKYGGTTTLQHRPWEQGAQPASPAVVPNLSWDEEDEEEGEDAEEEEPAEESLEKPPKDQGAKKGNAAKVPPLLWRWGRGVPRGPCHGGARDVASAGCFPVPGSLGWAAPCSH